MTHEGWSGYAARRHAELTLAIEDRDAVIARLEQRIAILLRIIEKLMEEGGE